MADRPILFSAPMVRALLAGTKTQTRRTLKPQPFSSPKGGLAIEMRGGAVVRQWSPVWAEKNARFAVGDRLWMKETWQAGATEAGPAIGYRADFGRWYPEFTGEDFGAGPSFDYDAHPTTAWAKGFWLSDVESDGPWASPLHMSRWASRLTLHVTEVRVQRLQEISEADAWAEGCPKGEPTDNGRHFPADGPDPSGIGERGWDCARDWYADLWNSINGPGSWEANPWVAAYTFTVEHNGMPA